jgi:hypothetical protein
MMAALLPDVSKSASALSRALRKFFEAMTWMVPAEKMKIKGRARAETASLLRTGAARLQSRELSTKRVASSSSAS